MRILHIIPALRKGGAERIAMDICAELATREGVEVKLIYLNDVVEYDTNNLRYPVQYIPSSVQLSITKSNTYNVAELERLINNWQPGIIHSHLFESEIVSRSITYPKAKWFTHCHDNMRQFRSFSLATMSNKQLLTEYYEKRYLLKRYAMNGGNTFICISGNNCKYFMQAVQAKYKVELLHNAINVSNFEDKQLENKKADGTIKLVTVGRLDDNKNQVFLLDVLKTLLSTQPATLSIIGDGSNKAMLQQKAEQLGISQHIIFHGNSNNVSSLLWQADIYVHSALTEGFGLVLIEAMAAGLPVVSLDAGGNRDIITNDVNGYILSEQNASGFAVNILALANDNKLYERIQQAGIQTAKQFDIVNYVDMLLRLYNE